MSNTGDGTIHNYEITCFLNEIRKDPRYKKCLTREEETSLGARLHKNRKDQDALDRVVLGNIGLVACIVRPYCGQSINSTAGDLMSVGHLGLREAASRYNPRFYGDKAVKHAKFSTYARWWIERNICEYLLKNRYSFAVSDYGYALQIKLQKLLHKLMQEEAVVPSNEELARRTKMKVEMVNLTMNRLQPGLSLDAPVQSELGESTIGDCLADDMVTAPGEGLDREHRTDLVYASFNKLDDRGILIMAYRFGLMGVDEESLKKVGARIQITSERTRQCQEMAMALMKETLEAPASVTRRDVLLGRRRCAAVIAAV